MNRTIDLLKNHRSVRKFNADPVDDNKLKVIIETAGAAATSNFIQAYSVIQVVNKDSRKKLAQLTGGQSWVEASPVFLVFCADLKRAENACEFEKKEMNHGSMEQLIIATVDVALAAQNAMTAAESMGLGGVFIGGIRNNPAEVCELLNIPNQVYPVFGMCLGYPAEQPEQKPRLPVDVILKKDSYQEDIKDLERYNEICREYYQNRSTGSREDTWTKQISAMVSKSARPHMKEFLGNKGLGIK
ncbi:MAG: oxygen-insensitive NADPH nitroreductase [Proteobacteria bacterium]|nr:oxygen-insensitive NADPH nitroreductase [Pseudomonadota bacterium]